MFTFSAHPAYITVSDGVQDAFRHVGKTWHRWLPMAALVAVVAFASYTVLYSILGSSDFQVLIHYNSFTREWVWAPDSSAKLASLVGPMLLIGSLYVITTVVAGWVITATAISDLRNQPFDVAHMINRGLWNIVAGLLIGVVVAGAMFAYLLFCVITLGIGFLLIFAVVPAAFYVAIRVIFVSLAIFDGFGPVDAIQESWRLSKGSVLRMFGWGLMAVLISLVISFIVNLAMIPFTSTGAHAVAQAISAAVAVAVSAFTVYLMAVLYESERARKNPEAYGLAPAPYPFGPNPYAQGPNPYAQGPNPYAQGPNPYAQGPNPYAQGPNPNAAWQGGPGTPQAWPAAPQAWPAAPQAWPPDPNATVPGFPGSQPPQWGAQPPQAWGSSPAGDPTLIAGDPTLIAGDPTLIADKPAGEAPAGEAPTEPPTAG